MGHHWKSIVFVTLVSLAPPLFLFSFYSRFSLTSDAIIAILGVYMLATYTYPFFTDPLRNLPRAPNPHFILGHGTILFSKPPGELYKQWSRTVPNDGLIYCRGFFHRKQMLIITSPEAAREVLLDKAYDFEKPSRIRGFLARILGSGLIVVEGSEHKMQRKAVAPAFLTQHIHELIPTFWEKSQEFVATLATSLKDKSQTGARSGVVEIGAIASRVTLDIIGLAGLGRNFRALHNSDDELAKQYELITDPSRINYWVANMMLPPWFVQKLPWSENTKFASCLEILRRTAFNLLHEKRASLEEDGQQHKDILTVLLKAKTPLTDDQLVDQLLTFLAAGHDTTSSALTWAVYILAKRPNIQERLREDVRRTFAKTDFDSEESDHKIIDSMPFLTAACNETLRLYPTVPNTIRTTARPTTVLGNPVPMHLEVIISMWALNRLPSLWGPDADEFKPERWLDPDSTNLGVTKSPYAFMTFLHGPRSCIGQGFARTELKYLLASLLLRFRWEMADKNEEIIPFGSVTIKPLHGMHVRLTELK